MSCYDCYLGKQETVTEFANFWRVRYLDCLLENYTETSNVRITGGKVFFSFYHNTSGVVFTHVLMMIIRKRLVGNQKKQLSERVAKSVLPALKKSTAVCKNFPNACLFFWYECIILFLFIYQPLEHFPASFCPHVNRLCEESKSRIISRHFDVIFR